MWPAARGRLPVAGCLWPAPRGRLPVASSPWPAARGRLPVLKLRQLLAAPHSQVENGHGRRRPSGPSTWLRVLPRGWPLF